MTGYLLRTTRYTIGFLIVLAAFLVLPVLSGRSEAARATAWARANEGHVPLAALRLYPQAYRHSYLAVASARVKLSLWRDHLNGIAAYWALDVPQRQFLARLAASLTEQDFAHPGLTPRMATFKSEALALLGRHGDLVTSRGLLDSPSPTGQANLYHRLASWRVTLSEAILAKGTARALLNECNCLVGYPFNGCDYPGCLPNTPEPPYLCDEDTEWLCGFAGKEDCDGYCTRDPNPEG